jgi:glycosyltransferase involved in cell wall biosynthesis
MGKLKPLIYWEGFPACGLIIKEVVDEFENIIILATRPKVPFKNLEAILGKEIIWLDDNFSSKSLIKNYSDRNFFIHTGWNNKNILKYAKFLKNKNQAKIVVAVDNNLRYTLRQIFGAIYFRVFLNKLFDGALVSGKMAKKLMIFLGMNSKKIKIGLYGAYEGIYNCEKNIVNRKNEFLYVGQFTKRKSIDLILKSYLNYRNNGGTWDLRLIGSGDLNVHNYSNRGIIIEDFLQPEEVSKKMNDAKVLLLVSKIEHWGTVACEAAACGMHLLLTKNIGSKKDLLLPGINGYHVDKHNIKHLTEGFFYFQKLSEKQLIYGSKVSRSIANFYNSKSYYVTFNNLLNN